MDVCTSITESLCCKAEIITTLQISYSLIQLFKNGKKIIEPLRKKKISTVLLFGFLLCTLLSSPKEGNFFINQDSDGLVIALWSCRDRMLQWPKDQLPTRLAMNPAAMLSLELSLSGHPHSHS